MPSIVLLSGEIAVGKSEVARVLEDQYDFRRVTTGGYLKTLAERRNMEINRDALKFIGDALDVETGGKWVADLALVQSQRNAAANYWLLDSIRRDFQLPWFKQTFDISLHVHLTASEDVRRSWYEKRRDAGGEYAEKTSFENAKSGPTELHVRSLGGICELLVDTGLATADDVAKQIIAKLFALQSMK